MQSLPRKTAWFLITILTITNICSSPILAQQKRASKKPAQQNFKRPKLVVGIIIDQFRYDLLTRFDGLFVEGGFNRLIKRGAVFANANYEHSPTVTACGHGTFMSGATPSASGIIGNEWFDRETGKIVTSVSDDSVLLLGGKEGATGMSPHRLTGTTVGDELKLATQGRAKVVGISIKDRGAILPAGKRPNGAFWFNSTTGNMASSNYYFKDLPDWVKKFNTDQRPERWFGKQWTKLLPEAAYDRSNPDDSEFEKKFEKQNTFPYTLNGNEEAPGPRFYGQFNTSPFSNDYLVDFAKAAIENEKMGADDITDLLTLSFSANDSVGHTYGPYSQEVQDITLRTDRIFAEFFDYLDKKVGVGNYIVAFTSDHGVGPIPEQTKALGFGGRLDAKSIVSEVEATLKAKYDGDKWVLKSSNGNIYLDDAAIASRKLFADEVEQVACNAISKIAGVAACFTRSQIVSGNLPNTPIAKHTAKGFFPKRNGNLVIVAQPFYLAGESSTAGHGSPYTYDTNVPVIFMGGEFKPGLYFNPAAPSDIAPTLSAVLNIIAPSNTTGRVLIEAIK